jgi:hypothetical protein
MRLRHRKSTQARRHTFSHCGGLARAYAASKALQQTRLGDTAENLRLVSCGNLCRTQHTHMVLDIRLSGTSIKLSFTER